jgi:small-conductance mechanosensitive channel
MPMLTPERWLEIIDALTNQYLGPLLRALILILLGLIAARLVSTALVRVLRDKLSPHRMMIFRRGSSYLVLTLFAVSALSELGFDLGVLLGAAGILTVAIGFASQTSMSNLISGLFLVFEQPFAVGDVITVDDITGEVLAIDLLSTKIRMFNNTYVRIPNETIIKTPVSNLTKFPIRRIDLQLMTVFETDINLVRTILFDVAEQNPLCLEDPKPIFIFQGYGEASVNLQFSVWVRREEFLTLQNSIQIEIKEAFDREGIEIPYPYRRFGPHEITTPFPIRIVSDEPNRTEMPEEETQVTAGTKS